MANESEVALHEQRDLLRVTLASIGDAVITTDNDGRVTFLNPVAEFLTGWTLAAAAGMALSDVVNIVNEESRQPVEIPTVLAFVEGRAPGPLSPRLLIARDGTERPCEDNAAPIRNDQGEVVGVVLVFRDITQRRKTERALAKALAFGEDIITTLREPFVVLDTDLRVKVANRSFYDSFQVSKEETENRFLYDLGNGQWNIPRLRTLLEEVISRNQPVYDFEVEHSFEILGQKTMLLNARPFPPDSQHPELILLALYDVSTVRAQADELAEANRRKDEFLAMLAHELRNPLAPIRNAVQLLRLQRDGTVTQREAQDMIERQVAQLARLVDDLMEISRVTTGHIHLQEERVDFRGVIDSAVETCRPQCGQKSQSIGTALPKAPIWLYGDPMRLEQVVVNLLNNACKYTDRSGHIWMGLEPQGDKAVLRVRDNGIGIAPELLPRIFDLFTQADKSLDRSQGGLGIGLALVRSLVTMHGGRVEAQSTPGRGSEFIVTLPLWKDEGGMMKDESGILPLDSSSLPHPSSLTVLVVDDNVDAANSVARLLRAFGHDVRMAHDAAIAMQAALEYVPEVVLLDIGLPVMNGYEVAKWIRQQPSLKDVVLVALTGYGQERDRQRSREAGFDHHLVKPADFAKVQHILSAVRSPAAEGHGAN